ncbi:efflux RND transporter periplasmic adaptor subunit [Vibrio sp. LaRot3]|uniref:efflux RND transporter periplasmic adaptor subunit n=1 Tax=Vibrio sp. LaRot3 TaxID=2998829 RepID=UPI0022CDF475|nr:efflux RND transporter periplasmic adaptor subunit [Vibrio sp. LaRot3]MDA0148292.1 efflux RND transporter periplasmic adaptor subunit [Vibrio sp. LaRot3]
MKRPNQFFCITALALLVSGCNQAQDNHPIIPRAKTVQVVELAEPDSRSTKHFSGVVGAIDSADLSFRIPGTIESVLVSKGDMVKKGQIIATLDPHDYQVTVQELEARLLEAESAHKLAKAELKRVKQATNDDAIAAVNLDRAISGYERSLAAIKVVQKNIQRAKDMLSYTELKAPFDGVVGSVNNEKFEQVIPGVAFATLQNDMQLEVDIDVPENLISEFELGQIGAVTWYQGNTELVGNVSEIAPIPHLIKQTYTVTYTLEKGDERLFPGKVVSVSASLGSENEDHCVPYSALVGEKQSMHVNLVRENRIVSTPVNLRSIDAYQACVQAEMQSGDLVVVSGSQYLADGDKVGNIVVRTQ